MNYEESELIRTTFETLLTQFPLEPIHVIQAVESIRKIAIDDLDDECAHSMEDRLHQRVLQALVNDETSGQTLRELAYLALESKKLDFARWCA